MSQYPALFRRFIAQETKEFALQIEASGALFDAIERSDLLHILNLALDCSEAQSDALRILQMLETEYRRAPAPEVWIGLLEQALFHLESHQPGAVSGSIHLHLGFLFQRCGDVTESGNHFQCCAEIYHELGHHFEEANALNRLAFSLRLQRRLDHAERTAQQAIDLLDNDDRREFSYNVLGMIAYDREEYRKALNLFKQALLLAQRSGDTLLIGQRLRNLGPAYRKLQKYDDAIECYLKALQIFEEVQAPYEVTSTLLNLGNAYTQCDELDDALATYIKAESILVHSSEWRQQAQLYTNLGMVQRKRAQFDLAEQSFKKAVDLWRKLKSHHSLANALDELATLYVCEERLEDAHMTLLDAKAALQHIVQRSSLHTLIEERLSQVNSSGG